MWSSVLMTMMALLIKKPWPNQKVSFLPPLKEHTVNDEPIVRTYAKLMSTKAALDAAQLSSFRVSISTTLNRLLSSDITCFPSGDIWAHLMLKLRFESVN